MLKSSVQPNHHVVAETEELVLAVVLPDEPVDGVPEDELFAPDAPE